jgi:hypothetical protein
MEYSVNRRRFFGFLAVAPVAVIAQPVARPAFASGGYVPPRWHSGVLGEPPAILRRGETMLRLNVPADIRATFDRVASENSRQLEIVIEAR